jgi:hypothetical protein
VPWSELWQSRGGALREAEPGLGRRGFAPPLGPAGGGGRAAGSCPLTRCRVCSAALESPGVRWRPASRVLPDRQCPPHESESEPSFGDSVRVVLEVHTEGALPRQPEERRPGVRAPRAAGRDFQEEPHRGRSWTRCSSGGRDNLFAISLGTPLPAGHHSRGPGRRRVWRSSPGAALPVPSPPRRLPGRPPR